MIATAAMLLVTTWLVHAVATTPSPSSTVVYLLGAALFGGLLQVAITAYRRIRRGPLEDEEMVGRIVQGEVKGMKDLLAEYRLEVELTKRQLEDYRRELTDVTHELARAQLRIGELERELRSAKSVREELRQELSVLKGERDKLVLERERLAAEAKALRTRVERLEQFAQKLSPDAAPPD